MGKIVPTADGDEQAKGKKSCWRENDIHQLALDSSARIADVRALCARSNHFHLVTG